MNLIEKPRNILEFKKGLCDLSTNICLDFVSNTDSHGYLEPFKVDKTSVIIFDSHINDKYLSVEGIHRCSSKKLFYVIEPGVSFGKTNEPIFDSFYRLSLDDKFNNISGIHFGDFYLTTLDFQKSKLYVSNNPFVFERNCDDYGTLFSLSSANIHLKKPVQHSDFDSMLKFYEDNLSKNNLYFNYHKK